MIDEAGESGYITLLNGLRQGQNAQVQFNDKNNFSTLMNETDKLTSIVKEFCRIASADLKKLYNTKNPTLDKHVRNLINLEQIGYQMIMSRIANMINSSVTNISDREILYLRLAEILIVLGELNKITMAVISDSIAEMERLNLFNPDVALRLEVPIFFKDTLHKMYEMMSELEQIH